MAKIIILSGLPGSGKSTIAEGVSRELDYPVFSVDPIESALLRAGIKRDYTSGLAAYVIAEKLADEHLKLGHSVIIDAVNGVPESKQMWRDLAAKYKATLIVIECVYEDEAVHKKRLEGRVRDIPGFEIITWDEVRASKNDYAKWDEPHLTIESSISADKNLATVLAYIKKQ